MKASGKSGNRPLPAEAVVDWRWPPSAESLRLYDKYSDSESVYFCFDAAWMLSVQGRRGSVSFSLNASERALQQKLIVLTQESHSPSAVYKFGLTITTNWEVIKELLSSGPESIKKAWRNQVTDIELARAGKTVLNFACRCSVGPWNPRHMNLVKGLDSHSIGSRQEQLDRLKRREKLLPIEMQAKITRTLDEASCVSDLGEDDLEGLSALAFIFQHGVRPVQALSLRMEHVEILQESNGNQACIVSFHAAKQRQGRSFELPRQVKPEWAAPVIELHARAAKTGRTRLFNSTTAEQLWTRVRSVCDARQGDASFKAGHLRHTAAQMLADAGHSRESIRKFLGQTNWGTAAAYIEASRKQAELINKALGASQLYGKIISMAAGNFVTLEELLRAPEDQQIGGIVGNRLVSGIGLCRSGQSACAYNPVTSCYGCSKFMPSLDRHAHEEAVSGMRAQITQYLAIDPDNPSPASLQLTRALSVAQQALSIIDGPAREGL